MVCSCHEPLLGEEVSRQIIAVVPQPVIRYVNDKWFQLKDRFLILYGFKQHFLSLCVEQLHTASVWDKIWTSCISNEPGAIIVLWNKPWLCWPTLINMRWAVSTISTAPPGIHNSRIPRQTRLSTCSLFASPTWCSSLPLSPLPMFCVVPDVPATPGGPLDPGAPGCPSFPGAPGIPSLPVRYKLAYSQNTHAYWRHQKMRVLSGNSHSFVFLPIHLLFPISTGVALSFILVPLCTVHHKCLLFSRKVDHLQGPK